LATLPSSMRAVRLFRAARAKRLRARIPRESSGWILPTLRETVYGRACCAAHTQRFGYTDLAQLNDQT